MVLTKIRMVVLTMPFTAVLSALSKEQKERLEMEYDSVSSQGSAPSQNGFGPTSDDYIEEFDCDGHCGNYECPAQQHRWAMQCREEDYPFNDMQFEDQHDYDEDHLDESGQTHAHWLHTMFMNYAHGQDLAQKRAERLAAEDLDRSKREDAENMRGHYYPMDKNIDRALVLQDTTRRSNSMESHEIPDKQLNDEEVALQLALERSYKEQHLIEKGDDSAVRGLKDEDLVLARLKEHDRAQSEAKAAENDSSYHYEEDLLELLINQIQYGELENKEISAWSDAEPLTRMDVMMYLLNLCGYNERNRKKYYFTNLMSDLNEMVRTATRRTYQNFYDQVREGTFDREFFERVRRDAQRQ